MKSLADNLIPCKSKDSAKIHAKPEIDHRIDFHSSSALRSSRQTDLHQLSLRTIRNLISDDADLDGSDRLVIDCKLMSLQVSLGNVGVKDDTLTSRVVPAFNYVYQDTFPDTYGLRARIVEEGCRLRSSAIVTNHQHYLLITEAENFMTMAFMLSHCPSMQSVFHYNVVNRPVCLQDELLAKCLQTEIAIMLATWLEVHITRVLDMLQETVSRQRRKDWPVVAVALCLLLFGIESMQVDVYLQSSREARITCRKMNDTVILMLTEIFSASTAGFNPLSLDWESKRNDHLVDNDPQAIDTMRGLQEIKQEYRKTIIS